MKTYYLTLSKVFPSTHKRAGEPTKFNSALDFAIRCAKIPERQKRKCMKECIAGYRKLHTIRANYDFWAKRFEKIAAGEAVLSIREWVGKPYGEGSSMRELTLLTHEDGIGIQKLEFKEIQKDFIAATIDGKPWPREIIANNDGLSLQDWREWFKDYDHSKPMAIIHFTKFRY